LQGVEAVPNVFCARGERNAQNLGALTQEDVGFIVGSAEVLEQFPVLVIEDTNTHFGVIELYWGKIKNKSLLAMPGVHYGPLDKEQVDIQALYFLTCMLSTLQCLNILKWLQSLVKHMAENFAWPCAP
jgi:hypothetical protein